jgi:hypothetical protein
LIGIGILSCRVVIGREEEEEEGEGEGEGEREDAHCLGVEVVSLIWGGSGGLFDIWEGEWVGCMMLLDKSSLENNAFKQIPGRIQCEINCIWMVGVRTCHAGG